MVGVTLVPVLRGQVSMPGIIGMVIGQCVVFFLVICLPLIRGWRKWMEDRRHQHVDHGSDFRESENSIVQRLLLEQGGLCRLSWLTGRPRPASLAAFQEDLRRAGLPIAVTIVDAGVYQTLMSLPRPDNFVEPERLLSAPSRRSWVSVGNVVAMAFFIWVLVMSALSGDWIITALCAAMFCLFGVQILKSYDVHVAESGSPIVGMGSLIDRKGRKWSVADSSVYIHESRLAFSTLVVVELIGPAGYLVLPYSGKDDAAITMFWQRWMHPHPRPDLV